MGMLRSQARNTNGRDRTHGRTLGPLLCGLVVVAFVLILAPMAQAASPGNSPVTITAPYTGATGYASSAWAASGCGAASIVHAPFFNWNNGRTGFSVRAHANSCSSPFGGSSSASASELVAVPITVPSANDTIRAGWVVNAALGASIGATNCVLQNVSSYSYCYATASAEVYGFAYLFDQTSGTYWYSAGEVFESVASSVYDTCYSGSCTTSSTGNQHMTVSTSIVFPFHVRGLNPSDSYLLVTTWSSDAYFYEYGYASSLSVANAAGSVTMAGPGMGATLEWITVA
jgi:hypothetical protein